MSALLTHKSEVTAANVLSELIPIAIGLLGWSCAWALLSRIFANATQFFAHLRIACVGVIVGMILSYAINVIAFSFSLTWVSALERLLLPLIVGGIVWFHLKRVWPHKPKLLGAFAVAAGLLTLLPKLLMNNLFTEDGLQAFQPTVSLADPALRMVDGVDTNTFFANSDKLKVSLDKAVAIAKIEREKHEKAADENAKDIE